MLRQKEKAQTSPVKGFNPLDEDQDSQEGENCQGEYFNQIDDKEEEILVDGSDTSSNSNNSLIGDLDCESDDEELQAKEAAAKKKELEEIQAWAIANGFQVQVEAPLPVQQKPKKQGSASKGKPTDDENQNARVIKEEGKVTSSAEPLLPEWKTQHIQNLINMPPPSELLRKQHTVNEPIRTGFNQGFLPVTIKDNAEHGRYEQGPKIVVTSEKVYATQNASARNSS
jgi:hypothetical protein